MSSTPTRALVGLALAGLVTASVVPVATAGERKGGDDRGRVVATGLDSPRHLSASARGDLYVAEAGEGGDDCVLGEAPGEPEPVEVCGGTTGAVTRVTHRGHQSRVVTGLPSLRLGEDVIGTSDAELHGRTLMISVGLGNPPETRDHLVEEHGRAYARLATVQSARLKGSHTTRLRTEADLARSETRRNPDGGLLDTNPNSIARDRGGWVVADAGANDVLRLTDKGRLRLVTVLPEGMAEAPPFLELPPGTQIPFQPVPTSAVRGPDGAIYVSQLTGFPFPQDGAGIWRVGRDGVARPWATGLTNVTDLAFDHKGRLYAVQLSDVGLLNETGLPSGSLVQVRKNGNHRTVVDDLDAPFGVALHRGDAYITTCTVCADGGQVMRFDLDR
ncbi:ScyD/ScyE family protein [Ornithinimicrobium pekingense]|uniref:ScyD/ScyE family protein n=1 Tax=Ornithinimicrobium pekingense TaxID=384677 RepID=A0ABQ2F9T9_9MICO|nr:ScyD/ScyE family protein [Ornithinimicrobium pekingense]GGK72534.1 hypothetical protein GCM10011509_21370 [Ornithinimicrobium pekingense]